MELKMNLNGTQVLDRTFNILEIIAANKNGLCLSEIVDKLDLSKSTTYRILNALCERGFIEKHPDKKYKLGLKLIEISSIYLNDIELKTEAKPYLWEITKKFGLPVHLAIRDNQDIIYIDKVDIQNNIRMYSQIGKRIPLYCSGLGKALLSGLDSDSLLRLANNINFIKLTTNTIDNKDTFINQINSVKNEGWALDNEEYEAGIRCLASPIYDYRGHVIAAISISGPSSILKKSEDKENGQFITEFASKISRRMGFIKKN
jgi:IclR family transcriptional regulator, KDG regulon repressor